MARIIALDIETVPREGIMDTWYPEWIMKKNPGVLDLEKLEAMAALYPEFGQVCCVSYADAEDMDSPVRHKLAGNVEEEREILEDIGGFLDNHITLVGHNIKGFDIPFLAKRYMAHGLHVPASLNTLGKKPWEIPHLDTMELMKFGSSNMSLRAACLLLGIKDPKENMDGEGVWECFKRHDMAPIGDYCDGDVEAVRGVFTALRNCTGAV